MADEGQSPAAFHPGAYKTLTLGFYLLGMGWYVKEGYAAYSAAQAAANVAVDAAAAAYPFYMTMNPLSTVGFSFTGGLYWTLFGLDRSNTPGAIAGYVMAGAHVLVFAIQVWLGPMLWAMNNLQ